MTAPMNEPFRAQLVSHLDAMDHAGISPEDKANVVIRMMVGRLSALVNHLDAIDPACALLRAEIRDIQAGGA